MKKRGQIIVGNLILEITYDTEDWHSNPVYWVYCVNLRGQGLGKTLERALNDLSMCGPKYQICKTALARKLASAVFEEE